MKFAVLSQRLDELEKLGKYKIKEVLSRYKPSYIVDGKEVTPGQLMERLGFESAQLMTPIRDLSGGQKRRMQLLLILLDEPNVLIMDEPGNDLDTDMLAVMEDLLDTWPGTLIVVSHDRYLLERVTDQQFALIGGKVRHLPGGVDDYLDMIEKAKTAAPAGVSASQKEPAGSGVTATADDAPKLSGKEFRETSKRISAIERKLAKLEEQKTALEADMAAHDPSDYEGLNKLNGQLQAVSDESGAWRPNGWNCPKNWSNRGARRVTLLHHLFIDALAVRADGVLRRVVLRHPDLAAQRDHGPAGELRFGDAIARHIVREPVGVAIVGTVGLLLGFRTLQHRRPRAWSGVDSGDTGSARSAAISPATADVGFSCVDGSDDISTPFLHP